MLESMKTPPVSEDMKSKALSFLLDMLCETASDEDKPVFEFARKHKMVQCALSDLLCLSSQIGNDSGLDAQREFSANGLKLMDSVYEQIREFAANRSFIDPTQRCNLNFEEANSVESVVRCASTKLLVDELATREGVECIAAGPYEQKSASVDGPAIMLIVTD